MSTVERVRELMIVHQLSQGEFAARVGLDGSKMSKSMAGVRRFSLVDLSHIAEEFDVTVDWLLTKDDASMLSAARMVATDGSVRPALEYARMVATQRADLASMGHHQAWRPLSTTVPLGGRFIDQGARLAAAALREFEASQADPLDADLASNIEQVFGADVAIITLGHGIDGLAVSTAEAKIIVLAASTIPYRQRFTLAHELCHLLAADDQGLHVDEDIYSDTSRRGEGELRANAFAAGLLMPENHLARVAKRGMNEEAFCRLASDLRVSPSALAWRLFNLGLIDENRRNAWHKLTAKAAAERAGQGPALALAVARASVPRPPSGLVRDTYAAYQQGDTTLRPYANLLGCDVVDLRADLEATEELEELED